MDRQRPSLPRNQSFFNYPMDDERNFNEIREYEPYPYKESTSRHLNHQDDGISYDENIFEPPMIDQLNNTVRSRNATLRWNKSLKETIEGMPSRNLPTNFAGNHNSLSVIEHLQDVPTNSTIPLELIAHNLADRMEQDPSLMDDTPLSAQIRMETLRDMPHCLAIKRLVQKRLEQTLSKKSKQKSLGFFKRTKYKFQMEMIEFKNAFKNFMVAFELWYSSLKMVEGNFGTGVASYFRFLRWLFIMTVLLAIPALGFIITPQILYSASRGYGSDNNAPFNWYEVFSGEGYFTNTIMYYGHYTNETINLWMNHSYYMPQAYIFTMLCLYFAAFVVVSVSTAWSYRRSFIETKAGLQNAYAQKVFCGWDFNIATKKAAELKSIAIYNELKELLSDVKEKGQKRSCYKKSWNWIMRIIVNLGTICLLGITGYVAWILLNEHRGESREEEYRTRVAFVTAVVMNFTMLLFPILFGYLTKFENYSNPSTPFKITLVRTYLLQLTIVGVLLVFWLTHPEGNVCWETSLSQEIYRLVLFDFIISVILASIFEILRYVFEKTSLDRDGLVEFDIARHTFQLIYSQTLFWAGFFFSPLLPVIVAIKLWLTWYIRTFCTMHFCKPYARSWRATQTTTLFYMLTFLTLFLSLILYGYLMSRVNTSNCGPLSGYSYMYQLITEGVLNLRNGSTFWNVVMFFLRPGVVALILIGICIAAYFLRAKAKAQQEMVKILRKMLVISAKDREFLLNYISKITADQWTQHQSSTSENFDSVSMEFEHKYGRISDASYTKKTKF